MEPVSRECRWIAWGGADRSVAPSVCLYRFAARPAGGIGSPPARLPSSRDRQDSGLRTRCDPVTLRCMKRVAPGLE